MSHTKDKETIVETEYGKCRIQMYKALSASKIIG
jgi:hypothetical protein